MKTGISLFVEKLCVCVCGGGYPRLDDGKKMNYVLSEN